MTDNEIIKALECCNRPANQTSCDDCPYQFSTKKCSNLLIKDAIDLINRQQAEIEELKTQRRVLAFLYKEERKRRKTDKAEAIKEFVERLKGHSNGEFIFTTVKLVENLVKEMVGDNK